jgi:hypothetical protein
LFSGFNNSSAVPGGNFSNAEFTGANTVNGPAFDKDTTRSAAVINCVKNYCYEIKST